MRSAETARWALPKALQWVLQSWWAQQSALRLQSAQPLPKALRWVLQSWWVLQLPRAQQKARRSVQQSAQRWEQQSARR